MSANGRILSLVTAAIVIVLVSSVWLGFGDLDAADPLPSLAPAYALRAWIPHFFAYLPVALVSALAIAFSFLVSPLDLGQGRLLVRARVTVGTVFIFIALHALNVVVLGPAVERRLEQIEFRSRFVRVAWDEARQAADEERWDEAASKARLVRDLGGASDDVTTFIQDAEIRANVAATQAATALPGAERSTPRAVEREARDVATLVADARAAFESGDFYTAHYLATRAIELSPTDRLDARRLRSLAFDAIERTSRELLEAGERALYERKRDAYLAFVAGASSPERAVEAYYAYEALAQMVPEDPDVRRYRPLAVEQLANVAFFVEDARAQASLPGVGDVWFHNRTTADWIEFVSFDHVVRVRTGDYVYGVEVLRLAREEGDPSRIVAHGRAPYGKLISGTLVLRAVSRDAGPDGAVEQFGPVGVDGSDPVETAIPVELALDDIVGLSVPAAELNTLALGALIAAPELYARVGRPVTALYAEILRRVFLLGSVPIALLGAIAFGWRMRNRYIGRPPWYVALGLPIIPLVIWREAVPFAYGLENVTRLMARTLPPAAAIAILAAVSVVGIVVCLALIATSTVEP